jgi:hypothetical protein
MLTISSSFSSIRFPAPITSSHLPEEIKQLGVLRFATFPPSAIDNTVTQLWDKHMRPDWREVATGKEAEVGKPRNEAQDHETVAEMRGRFDQAVLTHEAHFDSDAVDYIVIRRQVPVRKGKWRMVSKGVEDADSED